MGCENMGGLLYALVRFIKPVSVVELGGGFTSVFLLQALADNAAEAQAMASAASAAASLGFPWLVPGFVGAKLDTATLHVVDTLAHAHSTAGLVAAAADALQLRRHLRFHKCDALDSDLPSILAAEVRHFGLVWLDIGAGLRLDALVRAWWPRVDPNGGIVAVHSSLTNVVGQAWVKSMRAASASGSDPQLGCFEIMSFLEPHKLFQNSVTMLRRRGGGIGGDPVYDEPVFSKLP